MPKYHNKEDVIKVGKQIRKLRVSNNLTIEDVASATGFATSTISGIENGNNTDTSHLLEIAKAIKVHPTQLFDIDIELESRNSSQLNNKTRNFLTHKLAEVVTNKTFFHTPRLVADVIAYIRINYNIESNSTHVSVVLKRLANQTLLKVEKKGRKNLYSSVNLSKS